MRGRLYDEHHIEAPVGRFLDRCGIRISVAAYNTADEIDLLLEALISFVG